MMEILAACFLGMGVGYAIAAASYARELTRLRRQIIALIRENTSLLFNLQRESLVHRQSNPVSDDAFFKQFL